MSLGIVNALRSAAQKRAAGRSAAIPDSPIKWVQEGLGEHLWSEQREICEALDTYRARVVVPTCNGAGKTHLASRLAWHFALKHQHENARVVIVGASWDQLDEGTLDHSRKSRAIDPPGKLTLSRRWFDINNRHMIVWRSPPKGSSAKNILQGLHSEKMLIILEEASEIGFSLWTEATAALTSGGDARILAIGNPLDTGTPFHAASEPNSGWTTIQIGAHDTPNFTGEWVPKNLRDALPNKDWVKEQKSSLSKAEFRARVLGLFPERSEWALIEPEWVARAMADTHKQEVRNKSRGLFAIDPGSGGDPTVACYVKNVWRKPGLDVLQFVDLGEWEYSRDRESVAAFLAAVAKKKRSAGIIVDTFGVGGDFISPLARGAPGSRIFALNTGDRQKLKKYQRRHYYDPRAVIAWRFADRLAAGNLFLPDDRELGRQLTELRQKPEPGGLRRIEPKEEMMERLGRSPDLLDAAILTQWMREVRETVVVGEAQHGV